MVGLDEVLGLSLKSSGIVSPITPLEFLREGLTVRDLRGWRVLGGREPFIRRQPMSCLSQILSGVTLFCLSLPLPLWLHTVLHPWRCAFDGVLAEDWRLLPRSTSQSIG